MKTIYSLPKFMVTIVQVSIVTVNNICYIYANIYYIYMYKDEKQRSRYATYMQIYIIQVAALATLALLLAAIGGADISLQYI